jgi:hypothetical protein
MRVRLFGFALAGSLLAAFSPLVATAHTLRQDNGIHVELHIAPSDRPTPNTKTTYTLSFEDEPVNFDLAGYTLHVMLSSGSQTIAHHTLYPGVGEEVRDTVVFPKAGDYIIQVTGKPVPASENKAFAVSFPAHVIAPKSRGISPLVWAGGGGGIILIISTALVLERKNGHTAYTD